MWGALQGDVDPIYDYPEENVLLCTGKVQKERTGAGAISRSETITTYYNSGRGRMALEADRGLRGGGGMEGGSP